MSQSSVQTVQSNSTNLHRGHQQHHLSPERRPTHRQTDDDRRPDRHTHTHTHTHRRRLLITLHSQSSALQCILCSGPPLSVVITQAVCWSPVSPCRCAWLCLHWGITALHVWERAACRWALFQHDTLPSVLCFTARPRLSGLHFLSALPLFPPRPSFLSRSSILTRTSTSLYPSPSLFPGRTWVSVVCSVVTSLQDFLHCATLPCSFLRHLKLLCSRSPPSHLHLCAL